MEDGPSRHLAGSLRLETGAGITLFNGCGGEFSATISSMDRKRVRIAVGEYAASERESPLQIHLGIAVSRGERMDWVVQKSTELGVAEISPLTSERTEVKLTKERAGKKCRHWQQIAISACEQCGRNRVPRINSLARLVDLSRQVDAEHKVVLHHQASPGSSPAGPVSSLALLVGPEGGLSAREIALAGQAGFEPLVLGPRVLRTETAPLVALAIIQSHWGDMPYG